MDTSASEVQTSVAVPLSMAAAESMAAMGARAAKAADDRPRTPMLVAPRYRALATKPPSNLVSPEHRLRSG